MTVSGSSTIRVNNNTYSVQSRLIGEEVQVHLYADHLDLYYAQKSVDRLPRLRGKNRHLVNYRHVIDQLERKPGALENSATVRRCSPAASSGSPLMNSKSATRSRRPVNILKILALAARESEAAVTAALSALCGREPITADAVAEIVRAQQTPSPVTDVEIVPVSLASYDSLLSHVEVAHAS